jgi:hypothetical protein
LYYDGLYPIYALHRLFRVPQESIPNSTKTENNGAHAHHFSLQIACRLGICKERTTENNKINGTNNVKYPHTRCILNNFVKQKLESL